MRPGYGKHVFARQDVLHEPLRSRNIGAALIQNAFDERGSPTHDVPDHPQIRVQGELALLVALGQLDALRRELGTHRRIDVNVASSDSMARGLGDRGNASHESAADAEDMDVHEQETEGARRQETRAPWNARILAYFPASPYGIMVRLGPFLPVPKESKPRQQLMRARVAAAAARMMAEDGVEDFALAKRKAARQLGAADTQSLPKNEEIEAELRAYQTLYQHEEQRSRLQSLRERALEVMRLLSQFRPYLAGPVLKGTAGRYSDIDLQLFADDSKEVELFLLNRNIPFDISDLRHFAGDRVRAVPVLKLEWKGVPVNLAIYTTKDERGTLRATSAGRPIERAGVQSVALLLSDRDG